MSLADFVQLLIVLAAVLTALRLGGPPEKVAAAIVLAWVMTEIGYHLLAGASHFDQVDSAHLIFDVLELIAIAWLASCANRIWPFFATAAQLICVLGHFAIFFQPDCPRGAYWAMTQLPPLLQLLALVLGSIAHARRQRRFGAYRSWRLG